VPDQNHEVHDVLIVGGGPAGYTAAVYAARGNLRPVCIEGWGGGGQLLLTESVDNFPGFPDGIGGPELVSRIREQAERFGTQMVMAEAQSVDLSERPFRVATDVGDYYGEALIVATGARARTLGLADEERLTGRGIAYCAVCDAALFPDKRVFVVGGGDAAFEEALLISKFAREVVLVHRREEFRAARILQDYAEANEKINIVKPYVVEELLGEDGLTGLRLRNVETGEEFVEKADGMFVAIGHDPSTDLFAGHLERDRCGYLVVEPGSTRTTVEGVFSAGDVHDRVYRQAITAAASGCMAALDAEQWLAERAYERRNAAVGVMEDAVDESTTTVAARAA
jgi:thioredoxin reductase (NADPH)